jgi:hypothetical protein
MNAFELAVMNREIRLREFALPFTTVKQVASFICAPDNDTLYFSSWRALVLGWGSGNTYTMHEWRALGAELINSRQIPANWESMFATYASLAQSVFAACLKVMAS